MATQEDARISDQLRALGMVRNWNFAPSNSSILDKYRAWRLDRNRAARPAQMGIKPVSGMGAWVAYFVFAPDGNISPQHEFTLQRLKDEGFKIAVICATSRHGDFPHELLKYCDAVYWKGLPGFDFSAYTLILEEFVKRAEGSDVLLLNDSVFGPLHPVRPLLRSVSWEFTSFTGAKGVENHAQSYAFHLRGVTQAKLDAMRPIFPENYCYDEMMSVVKCQEIPMARVLAGALSAGMLWFPTSDAIDDPCLEVPFELLADGFPFLKRSLVGKFSFFGKHEAALSALSERGHPLPVVAGASRG